MPLSDPKPREKLHTRRITCEGFLRLDGLWEIEAHMTDVKTYLFTNKWRGEIKPGEAIHEMRLRIAVDDDMMIQEIEAATDNSPFELCPAIVGNFNRLIGLKIGAGFNRRVKERVGGVAGCTHLVELLAPMATVAYQTTGPGARQRRAEILGLPPKKESFEQAPPDFLDTCHAWARTGPVVKEFMPQFYVEPEGD